MEAAPNLSRQSTPVVFEDGIGERLSAVGGANESLEVLKVSNELSAVSTFESALKEQTLRLAEFRHESFARVRAVERLDARTSTVVVISERVRGVRLSEVLATAERQGIPLELDAALCLIRQLVTAVAALHDAAPDSCHGAIAPERIVVTPDGRLVLAEYVLGPALEELRFSQERYWRELGIALPHTFGLPRFDLFADVTQIGAVALAIFLGRRLRVEEYPAKIGDVVDNASSNLESGGFMQLPALLRAWLRSALQLEPRHSFVSAIGAKKELEIALSTANPEAERGALRAFLNKYVQAVLADHASEHVETAADTLTAVAPMPAATPAPVSVAAPSPVPVSDPDPVASAPVAAYSAPPVAVPSATPPPATSQPAAPPVVASAATPVAPSPASLSPASAFPASPSPVVPPVAVPVAAPAPLVAPVAPAPGPVSVVNPVTAPRVAVPAPVAAPVAASVVAPVPAAVASPVAVPKPVEARTPAVAPPAPQRPAVTSSSGASVLSMPVPHASPVRPVGPAPMDEEDGPRGHEPRASRPLWMSPWVGVAAAVLVVATLGFTLLRPSRPAVPAAVATGTLTVGTNPDGVAVFIDGVNRGTTPLNLTLPAGEHVLELVTENERRRIPVALTAGAQVSQYFELPKGGEATDTGSLQIRTDPPRARVSVDGQMVGRTPTVVNDLTPGPHQVLLETDTERVSEQVIIEAGVTASLMVPMKRLPPGTASGWIAVSVPAEVQIYENQRLIGSSRTERIMVSVGRHELELVNESLGFRQTRTVDVANGQVAAVRPDWPRGSVALNALPWAEVFVDGERLGETPIGGASLPIGVHEVIFRHPELGERKANAIVTLGAPARLSVDMRAK